MKLLKTLLTATLVTLGLTIPLGAADFLGTPTVATVALLRNRTPTQYPMVMVQAANATSGKGGGLFIASTCTVDDGGVCIQGHNGFYKRVTTGSEEYMVTWFGAACNGVRVADVATTAASATIASASAKWAGLPNGAQLYVYHAWVFDGVVNYQLMTTISSVNSAGSITMATTATPTATGLTAYAFTDDTTAIDAATVAAGRDGRYVGIPNGEMCGYAQVGSSIIKSVQAYGLKLNGGTLLLAQAGETIDNGIGWSWQHGGEWIIGPGTVDGMYQGDQGAPQFNTTAFTWPTGSTGGGIRDVTIQNMKGRAFFIGQSTDFTLDHLTMYNCGDWRTANSGTLGDMLGRSLCGEIQDPKGTLRITQLTAVQGAQSGILVDNLAHSTEDPNLQVIIEGCSFKNMYYYGLDLENLPGHTTVNNCSSVQTGLPTGVNVMGNLIARNVQNFSLHQWVGAGSDGNNTVVISNNGFDIMCNADLVGLDVKGSSTNHQGTLTVNPDTNCGAGTRMRVSGASYEVFQSFLNSGLACSTTAVNLLFDFDHLYALPSSTSTYQTIFTHQANANTYHLVRGADSSIGKMEVISVGAYVKAVGYDFRNVIMNGTPTLSGIASITYIAPTLTNPITAYPCP